MASHEIAVIDRLDMDDSAKRSPFQHVLSALVRADDGAPIIPERDSSSCQAQWASDDRDQPENRVRPADWIEYEQFAVSRDASGLGTEGMGCQATHSATQARPQAARWGYTRLSGRGDRCQARHWGGPEGWGRTRTTDIGVAR